MTLPVKVTLLSIAPGAVQTEEDLDLEFFVTYTYMQKKLVLVIQIESLPKKRTHIFKAQNKKIYSQFPF